MPEEDVHGSGAFQADAFQADAFGFVTIRTTASRMTLDEVQSLGDVLGRYKLGEASEQELIDAVPEPARSIVRASGERRLAWAGILLSAASIANSVASTVALEHRLDEQRRETHAMALIVEAEAQSIDHLLEELRELKATKHPHDKPHPGQSTEDPP